MINSVSDFRQNVQLQFQFLMPVLRWCSGGSVYSRFGEVREYNGSHGYIMSKEKEQALPLNRLVYLTW